MTTEFKTLASTYKEILDNMQGLVQNASIDERICEDCHAVYDSSKTPSILKETGLHYCNNCWDEDSLIAAKKIDKNESDYHYDSSQ